MKGQLINLAVLFCLLLGISPISQAQSNSNCFTKAAKKIKPGKKVTLIKPDGSQISGQLQSIDTVGFVLNLYQFTQTDSQAFAYQISDITKIRFKEPGKFRPEFSVGGLLVGAMVGAISVAIGNSIRQSMNFWGPAEKADVSKGAIVGGGVGLFLGTVVGLMVNSTRTIECK